MTFDAADPPDAVVRRFTSQPTDPRERGREFGSRNPERIAATVEFYRSLLARCPRPDVDLLDWGGRAWTALEALCPPAATEIAGIAEGAGLPVEAVAGINARTEILALADPDGAVECSTVVSLGAAGVRGAQTWDWYDAQRDNWLVWTMPLPDGGWLSTVTEYGILGKIGVNSSGVGVLFSILHHERDGGPPGDELPLRMPVHVIARQVLERATTLRGAVGVARRQQVTASSTLTILDSADAVSVELHPGGAGLVRGRDGALVHTNHFLGVDAAAGCLAHRLGPNSRIRHRSLQDATRGHPLESETDLLSALRGHDPDGPVCVHTDGAGESTLATVVIDPAVPELKVWPTWPCAAGPER